MPFFNSTKNQKLLKTTFCNFEYPYTFLGVMWGLTQNLGPISSTVLTFIRHKQTAIQAKYIYIAEMKDWIAWWVFNTSEKTYLFRFIIRCEFELQGVQYFMESSSTLLFSLVSPTYTVYSLCTVHKPYKKITVESKQSRPNYPA